MPTNTSNNKNIHIEDYLVCGTIYLIYTIKIEDFIEKIIINKGDNSALKEETNASEISHYVNRFRGTREFEKFCGKDTLDQPNINYSTPTASSDKDRAIRENGYLFSIFRHNLTDNWLSINTTHYEQKEIYKIPDEADIELNCNYYVRLSYSGIVELRKEIEVYDINFFTLQKFLLGLKVESKSNWDNVKKIFAKFVNTLAQKTPGNGILYLDKFYKIVSQSSPPENENATKVKGSKFILKTEGTIDTIQKRQSYSVILADKIKFKNGDTISEIKSADYGNAQHLIRGILEGSLKKHKKDKVEKYIFPTMAANPHNELKDFSTWEDEFCYIGAERTFIYYKETELKYTENENNGLLYKDYWEGIIRGIENTVSLNFLLKILHNQTTDYLCGVPDLMRRFAEINKRSFEINTENDEEVDFGKRKNLTDDINNLHKDLFEFARKVSNISNIVPKVRNICITSSAFRSSMVIDKFEHLYENCFNTSTLLKNLTDNINELTDFLLFFQQQQLLLRIDEAGEKVDEKNLNLGRIALLLTFASILYVSASFWNDLYAFIGNLCLGNNCGKINFKAMVSILSYLAILVLIYILFKSTLKNFQVSISKTVKKSWQSVLSLFVVYLIIILIILGLS